MAIGSIKLLYIHGKIADFVWQRELSLNTTEIDANKAFERSTRVENTYQNERMRT